MLIGRAVMSLGLLVFLAFVVDIQAVMGRFAGLEPGWVAAALLVSIFQVVLSAWRWRFTANQLGLFLSLPYAVSEYYLATFLNQVLPGGIVGDVSRAWRHAKWTDTRAALQSVAFERFSGLMVMSVVALFSTFVLFGELSLGAQVCLVGLVLLLPVCVGLSMSRSRGAEKASKFFFDLRRALLVGVALPVQLITSGLVVGSYVLMFVMAARAVQLETGGILLATLAAPILMTMLVPITIAGWGLRELVAAVLWSAAGLSPADGVAVSVSYGLLVLASSLPGACVFLFTMLRIGGLDQKADPSRSGSDGP
jgi:uncharacterized membrane protein YbhN (UPF0104 family)